jgi:hypothetical protein
MSAQDTLLVESREPTHILDISSAVGYPYWQRHPEGVETVLNLPSSRSLLPTTLAATLILLAGCGGSSIAVSTATPRPTGTAVATTGANPASVAVARRFIRAFLAGNTETMLQLMTLKLLARNRHEFVSQMLGVNGTPGGFTVVRSHTFHTASGPWTRVVVRFNLDHGASVARIGLIKTAGGWRVNTIRHVGSVV